jgi:hypothetical protein
VFSESSAGFTVLVGDYADLQSGLQLWTTILCIWRDHRGFHFGREAADAARHRGAAVWGFATLKALPTPRTRGAIPNWRSTPTLQHSNTPIIRVAGFEDEDENEAPHERCLGPTYAGWSARLGCLPSRPFIPLSLGQEQG